MNTPILNKLPENTEPWGPFDVFGRQERMEKNKGLKFNDKKLIYFAKGPSGDPLFLDTDSGFVFIGPHEKSMLDDATFFQDIVAISKNFDDFIYSTKNENLIDEDKQIIYDWHRAAVK